MQSADCAHRIGLLTICMMTAAGLCAQQATPIQTENGVYTLHEDTHLVLLDVTVTDFWGHPVIGLTKDNFKLLEDGQPQAIKFFEEHAPLDPAQIAKEKAAALADQPPNTFSSYEPFTGRPVTVLLLNLLTIPGNLSGGAYGLYADALDVIQKAPPDTPFAIYVLDSELRLVQPITTDHELLLSRIETVGERWNLLSHLDNPRNPVLWHDPIVGNKSWPKSVDAQGALIAARRKIMMTAVQELASGLKDSPGRKNLFFFTGGLRCEVVENATGCSFDKAAFPNSNEFLCGLMDTLEQGRIWPYVDYGRGHLEYGFGCRSTGAPLQDIQGTSSRYYTLYYTPTNQDWDGTYRSTTVEVTDKKGMNLAYRKGYFGTQENAAAHYFTSNLLAVTSAPSTSVGLTVTATTVLAGGPGSGGSGADSSKTPPNPATAVFSVHVVSASATSADGKSRKLILHLTMPASEFKVTPSGGNQYAARLEISAVPNADGKALDTYGSEVAATFNSADDPRIATSTIAATLTLDIPEHGRNRWIDVSVRDVATGQSGGLVIPMEQVKMP